MTSKVKFIYNVHEHCCLLRLRQWLNCHHLTAVIWLLLHLEADLFLFNPPTHIVAYVKSEAFFTQQERVNTWSHCKSRLATWSFFPLRAIVCEVRHAQHNRGCTKTSSRQDSARTRGTWHLHMASCLFVQTGFTPAQGWESTDTGCKEEHESGIFDYLSVSRSTCLPWPI